MTGKQIRCCLLGGQEKDLYVLGELHKLPEVEIIFVYDKDPGAVGLEIAEILGIPRASRADDLRDYGGIEYVLVSEPRATFQDELATLSATGAKIVSQAEAMTLFGQRPRASEKPVPAVDEKESYSVEDALAAFERLFDRKQLLKFLLDVSVEAAGATAGSIMLYSQESRELYIAYATGLSERVVRNTRQKLGEGIAGSVAKARKGKLIARTPDQPLYPADRDRSDIGSAISVPLVWEKRLLGVLNVSSDSASRQLTEDGLVTLQRLSRRISRVLNESLKLQETQIRHREMNLRQSMGELSEKSISTQAKFSLISNLLGELVGADTVEVFVGTQEGDWLVLGGSNKRYSTQTEMVRCERGALSRAYLERRTIVLTETVERHGEPLPLVSSFAFVPLFLKDTLGVLMLEFSDHHKLDEFLIITDSITLELSRFIASEKREKNLKRELDALANISEAAPMVLTCRTLDDLCDFIARLVADLMEAERVSVRVLGRDDETGKVSRFESTPDRGGAWVEEDDERFLKLKKKQQAFNLAFLNFAPDAGDRLPAYHSLLAAPIMVDDVFRGGIIAYDKRPANPLEDATFSGLDRSIIQHVVAIAAPAIRALSQPAAAEGTETAVEKISCDELLYGNVTRLKKIMESEMSRSDRYHHAFSLLLLKIRPLQAMFDDDEDRAIMLIDEITRGVQTRTRKTDYGSWIAKDTYAMVSLEGSRRIRFLISRLMLYLLKDFSEVANVGLSPADILVGHTFYPGTAKTPEALLDEVEKNLEPYGQNDQA
jgi:GAF domain-containing protein